MRSWERVRDEYAGKPILLGLERVRRSAGSMTLRLPPVCLTVGGTNGKGSVCAYLDCILRCGGYRVGTYTSPHILGFGERIRLQGCPASDELLDALFSHAAAADGAELLTQFELDTLAALVAFSSAQLDVMVLEVGMGGRLDACNVVDSDCSIVTSVGIDHTEFLGSSREQIGFEKAGIFRACKPAIVGDAQAPVRLVEHARAIGADLQLLGRDFGYRADQDQWAYWGRHGERGSLPYPGLRGSVQLSNASTCIAALDAVSDLLPVSMQDIHRGLLEVELPGRFQVLSGRPVVVLDVAHNPQAAAVLADNLSGMGPCADTWAVFGMLRDKDVAGVVRLLAKRIDHWMVCTLPPPRGAQAAELAQVLQQAGMDAVRSFESAALAYAAARSEAGDNDRIVVFGSFHTVADILAARESPKA